MSESRERGRAGDAILPLMAVPVDFEHRYRPYPAAIPVSTGTSSWASRRPASTAAQLPGTHASARPLRFYPTARRPRQPASAPASAASRVPSRVADWDVRGNVAGRAMRLIADGVVERDGVPGLASRLGYGERQLGESC